MNELILIIAIIFIGILASISETMFRAMVIVALLCIYKAVIKC
jgi:hypothetical protein